MINKPFLLLVLFIFSLPALSQDNFASVLKKGDDARRRADYQGALKLYNAAETFPGSQKNQVDEKRRILFNEIEGLYRASKKAKDSINILFDEVTIQKAKADSALAKAERFINALTFYADKFALAYKNGKVGFINKNGVPVIPYRYETAGAFDYTGLAKVYDIQEFSIPNTLGVKKEFRSVSYLIDTSDTQFKVAYQLDDLQEKEQIIEEEKIKAVDLRKTTLLNFPPGLKNHPQVEVLILDGELNKENNLKTITPELPFFTNLKYLSLRYCKLDSLPTDIGILDSLQSLDLEVNNIKQFPESFARLKE